MIAAPSRSRNSSRLGRPVRLSWTASWSRRSSAVRSSVTSRSVPTQRMHLAVRAEHRPGAEVEPAIVAVLGAEAEILRDAAAAQFDGGVERRLEAVAVAGVENLEPVARRPFERAALQAEQILGLRAGVDAVARHVPVPDDVAGAGQRQRLPLGVADRALRHDAAGEGVLHHREADQEHDQHQPAGERRLHDVVDEAAGHRQPRREGPDQQQHPGRDQHDRAVVAVGREIDDQREAEDRRSGRSRSARCPRRPTAR